MKSSENRFSRTTHAMYIYAPNRGVASADTRTTELGIGG
jgi:hypothetical protein